MDRRSIARTALVHGRLRRRHASAIALTACAAVALSGCFPTDGGEPTQTQPARAAGVRVFEIEASASPAPAPASEGSETAPSATPPTRVQVQVPQSATWPVPEAELVPFTTRNGTVTFRLPANWLLHDTSRHVPGADGEPRWVNVVEVFHPDGQPVLAYADGGVDEPLFAATGWQVAEQRPIAPSGAGALAATSWWIESEGQAPIVRMAVTAVGGAPDEVFPLVADRRGSFRAILDQIEGCDLMVDAEDARACLTGDEARVLLQVLWTLEVHDVPADAMP